MDRLLVTDTQFAPWLAGLALAKGRSVVADCVALRTEIPPVVDSDVLWVSPQNGLRSYRTTMSWLGRVAYSTDGPNDDQDRIEAIKDMQDREVVLLPMQATLPATPFLLSTDGADLWCVDLRVRLRVHTLDQLPQCRARVLAQQKAETLPPRRPAEDWTITMLERMASDIPSAATAYESDLRQEKFRSGMYLVVQPGYEQACAAIRLDHHLGAESWQVRYFGCSNSPKPVSGMELVRRFTVNSERLDLAAVSVQANIADVL